MNFDKFVDCNKVWHWFSLGATNGTNAVESSEEGDSETEEEENDGSGRDKLNVPLWFEFFGFIL